MDALEKEYNEVSDALSSVNALRSDSDRQAKMREVIHEMKQRHKVRVATPLPQCFLFQSFCPLFFGGGLLP